MHLLAAFPFQWIFTNEQDYRDILIFKMLRVGRLSTDFIPDDVLLTVMQSFYINLSRDDKIANDRYIINIIKIFKQILYTFFATYFLGLLWYRFSDHWQRFIDPSESSTRYWVVYFGLKKPDNL